MSKDIVDPMPPEVSAPGTVFNHLGSKINIKFKNSTTFVRQEKAIMVPEAGKSSMRSALMDTTSRSSDESGSLVVSFVNGNSSSTMPMA